MEIGHARMSRLKGPMVAVSRLTTLGKQPGDATSVVRIYAQFHRPFALERGALKNSKVGKASSHLRTIRFFHC